MLSPQCHKGAHINVLIQQHIDAQKQAKILAEFSNAIRLLYNHDTAASGALETSQGGP